MNVLKGLVILVLKFDIYLHLESAVGKTVVFFQGSFCCLFNAFRINFTLLLNPYLLQSWFRILTLPFFDYEIRTHPLVMQQLAKEQHFFYNVCNQISKVFKEFP